MRGWRRTDRLIILRCPVPVNENHIFAMLKRRPCTAEHIAEVFGMHLNEVSKYIGKLMRSGQIQAEHKDSNIYYKVI